MESGRDSKGELFTCFLLGGFDLAWMRCTTDSLKWSEVLVFVVLPGVLLSGCSANEASKPTAHLQGTVTIDGEPLPTDARGSITFKPTVPGQARSTSARIIDSRYDAPDVPRGTVKVHFGIQQATGRMVTEGTSRPYPEHRSLVPEKYHSGIELDIEGDNLSMDFNLETDGTSE